GCGLVLGLFLGRLAAGHGADAVRPGMGWDGDQRLAHVVGVVRLLEGVAEAGGGVEEPAGVLAVRLVGRIGGDADDVVAGRDDRLTVAAVEDEVLAAEEEAVGVGPAVADALVAGVGQVAAAP